ncbi:MAG: efflux RND transporter periplasmic adaptor subunit [Deltaproteobacteria bacterium]|nr:efflux RND transporter periplasmic adaptor subunit [Deltaproteobacteria bacterium]
MRFKTLALLFIVLVIHTACGKEDSSPLAPPEIPVFQTIEQDIPIYQEFVGQVYGFKDIAIRARVEGFLEGIHFKEGSQVDKGALLYTLESQPFEADVAAKMSMVAEAKTMLAKAESDLNRIRPLAEKNAVSQSDLDSAIAIHEAAIASVEAAEANLKASNIQLSYTKISSPLSGIIGKTKAKVGDFVGRSPNPVILNTVSRIDTVLVEFFITETEYLKLARRYLLSETDPQVDHRQESVFELILADGSRYEHKGKFEFIDREVDPTTGAILIQASFPNPEPLLRPGQFARIKAEVEVVTNGILIPQRCITELQGMYQVYVVNDKNQIEMRKVTTGPKIKDFWLIRDGLGPGEKVVYEGLQKIKEGSTINPVLQDITLTIEEVPS